MYKGLNRTTTTRFALFVGLLLVTATAAGQKPTDGIDYTIEAQGAVSKGNTPLWLSANKYGLSSIESTNGYARAAMTRRLATDSLRRWGVGYGVDMAVAHNFTSTAIVQQMYVEGQWLKGVLTIGSKEQPMEQKDNDLSSGAQTLGKNARPVPQVRLALGEYWEIPYTKGWVSLKGHLAYGVQTDGKWQEDFTQAKSNYVDNTLYHSKAGYIRIGNEHKFVPWSLEIGMEMATQFGGTIHYRNASGKLETFDGGSGISSFWHALWPGGSDVPESKYKNVEGNMLGSYVVRFNYDTDTWRMGLYADHFFEDHSGMFFVDYDGYGEGREWNIRKKNKYFVYSLKDIMLGVDLEMKTPGWLKKIVFEYIYTKYQSGPIYHDHTQSLSEHIGGVDNYYNHYVYGGWQHWGMTMGNALYLSPIYNEDGAIEVRNNRFYAFHLGAMGEPSHGLHYKVMATYQKGFGTYLNPYTRPRENVSLLAQASYHFLRGSMAGVYVRCGVGADFGRIYGNNRGVQLTIGKTFKSKYSKWKD